MDPARAVIVVEGHSDRVALESLARRLGRDLEADGVRIAVLGGATNVAALLQGMRSATPQARLCGMYDLAEERFFRRGLERAGHGPVPDRDRLEKLGFFACVADLEDELVRALGVAGVEAVIEAHGELPSLRILQQQPAQRGRTETQQLRRFLGTRSGRKERYAAHLVEAIDLNRVPDPLLAVLSRV